MGTACYIWGAEKIVDEFKKELKINVGEVTPDGQFSLDCLRCVGACGLAPPSALQMSPNAGAGNQKKALASQRTLFSILNG
jgi:NADH-quinone oxidoreductase subunit E/NADP-reducing hydrogenase subunit HndA